MSTESPKLSKGFRMAMQRAEVSREIARRTGDPGITYDSFDDYLADMHRSAAEYEREKAGKLVEYTATPEELAAAREMEAEYVAEGLVPGRDFQTFEDFLKEMNGRAAELERQASSGTNL